MPAMTMERALEAEMTRPGGAPAALPRPQAGLPRRLRLLPLLLLAIALPLLLAQWREPALTRLQIEGRFNHVRPQAVREAAAAVLVGGFFSIDITAVRDAVGKLPWVARARVERVWPAGLRIRVWEREPFARWNGEALLDTGAVAFTPAAGDLPQSVLGILPRLAGTPGNEALVMQSYRLLAERLANTPFAIAGLSLDARGEWTAQTQDGVELRLGQGPAEDKLPVILDALPMALGNRLQEVAYVDLRYTNGFAIGWRDGAASRAPAAAARMGRPHG